MICLKQHLFLPECTGEERKDRKYLKTAYNHQYHHGQPGNGIEVGIISHIS